MQLCFLIFKNYFSGERSDPWAFLYCVRCIASFYLIRVKLTKISEFFFFILLHRVFVYLSGVQESFKLCGYQNQIMTPLYRSFFFSATSATELASTMQPSIPATFHKTTIVSTTDSEIYATSTENSKILFLFVTSPLIAMCLYCKDTPFLSFLLLLLF